MGGRGRRARPQAVDPAGRGGRHCARAAEHDGGFGATPVDLVVAFRGARPRRGARAPSSSRSRCCPRCWRHRTRRRADRSAGDADRDARRPRTFPTRWTPRWPTRSTSSPDGKLSTATRHRDRRLRRPGPAARRGGGRRALRSARSTPAGAFDLGALATAAQILGAGAALLERSTDIRDAAQAVRPADRRVPGGQAPARRRAVGLELARPLLLRRRPRRRATPTLARDVSAAKVACTDAAYRAARGCAAGARRDRLHRRVRPVALADEGPRLGVGLGHAAGPPRPGAGGDPRMTAGFQRRAAGAARRRARAARPSAPTAPPCAARSRHRAGYDESLWPVLCEQIGVAALAVPEQFGGVGAGAARDALVVRGTRPHADPGADARLACWPRTLLLGPRRRRRRASGCCPRIAGGHRRRGGLGRRRTAAGTGARRSSGSGRRR